MEFTGRITADAKISTVKGDKQVVNFSVAINDRYKPKGSDEVKEHVTFINVAWWLGTGIAKILNKGAIVTVSGRLFCNPYTDMSGNAKASITCHASDIKLVHSKKMEAAEKMPGKSPAELTQPLEDLPF